ncbi:MAG: AAA family ATPase, partial [Candidatus Bathyarchaeia archaeon]
LPDDDELEKDLEILLKAYEQYAEKLHSTPSSGIRERISAENISVENNDEKNSVNNNNSRLALLISELYKRVSMRGFFYPEDDFRTFCVSLKTKPFVLLTGISGTGKTRLVELVARQFEGAREYTIPVRPDWSDSSDLLGYRDIQGNFRPGPLLEILREANENPTRPFFICLDEMNLARVEHYFAEFLSVIEKRELRNGKISTPPVVGHYAGDGPWSKVYVSDNVFLIGTVNMDETTHPFSRKVLDRANILEFNKIELAYHPSGYPMSARLLSEWEPLRPSYCRLPEFYSKDPEMFERVISIIKEINVILEPGLFHVGYRVRDEICLFMLHAKEAGFEEFLALDMQILSKILPRIQGSSATVRRILLGIWNWATGLEVSEDDPELLYKIADLPEGNRFPKTAEKVKIMLQRLEEDGYTSFWV